MKPTKKNLDLYWIEYDEKINFQDYWILKGIFKRNNNQLEQDYYSDINPTQFINDYYEYIKALPTIIINKKMKKIKHYYISNIENYWYGLKKIKLLSIKKDDLKVLNIKFIKKYKEECFRLNNTFYSLKTLKECKK